LAGLKKDKEKLQRQLSDAQDAVKVRPHMLPKMNTHSGGTAGLQLIWVYAKANCSCRQSSVLAAVVHMHAFAE
jgi:hypothetical protein